MIKNIYRFLKTALKARIRETSTWIGLAGFLLLTVNFTNLLYILFLFAVFMPEKIWDKLAEDYGAELEKKMQDVQETPTNPQ